MSSLWVRFVFWRVWTSLSPVPFAFLLHRVRANCGLNQYGLSQNSLRFWRALQRNFWRTLQWNFWRILCQILHRIFSGFFHRFVNESCLEAGRYSKGPEQFLQAFSKKLLHKFSLRAGSRFSFGCASLAAHSHPQSSRGFPGARRRATLPTQV